MLCLCVCVPNLQDKYDVICSHTDHAIEFVKRMSNFMKDRANVEQNYAKDLRYAPTAALSVIVYAPSASIAVMFVP